MIVKTKKVQKKLKVNEIVIKEVKDRGKLNEGRTNGMGFGFLNKLDDNNYETVQPLSPCKDYLHEPCFTEMTGIPTMAFGLNYSKKLNIFKNGIAYMAIKMMPTIYGNYYHDNPTNCLDDDIKLLEKNHKNIEKLINQIEKKLKLKSFTKVEKANDNYFLVTFSDEWCKSTYSISLYSYLFRVLIGADGSKNCMSYLEEVKPHTDGDMIKDVIPKLKLILKKKMFPPNRHPYVRKWLINGMHKPHNNGIMSWDSKFEEVSLKEDAKDEEYVDDDDD